MTRAVFFDVDFTLIYPGPTFQGEGYARFCRRHGIQVNPSAFDVAVASASAILDDVQDDIYDPDVFVDYVSHIIEAMGGSGGSIRACAREIYEEWAACQHFSLYDDVPGALRALDRRGVRIGLISNTHRCLESFQSHFELDGLIAAAVSSSVHGYMKPHPSIFEAALGLVGVEPAEAMMVGDSVRQDIGGARAIGMRAVLVCRSGRLPELTDGTPVVRTLDGIQAHL